MLSKECLWRSPSLLPVLLDGRLVGAVALQSAAQLTHRLRQLKRDSLHQISPGSSGHGFDYGSGLMNSIDWNSVSVPPNLECVLVLPHELSMKLQSGSSALRREDARGNSEKERAQVGNDGEDGSVGGSTGPGLFLFTEPGRMVRAVAAIGNDGKAALVFKSAAVFCRS